MEQQGTHILASDDSAPLVLAVGLCACCCAPLTEESLLRKHVEGEDLIFCSERCTTKYKPRDLFHW